MYYNTMYYNILQYYNTIKILCIQMIHRIKILWMDGWLGINFQQIFKHYTHTSIYAALTQVFHVGE